MKQYRPQRCGPIDSRLLREMTDAARAFRRSRGANRLVAVHRYVAALHRFTDQALRSLATRERRRGLISTGYRDFNCSGRTA
jgi:hypothetical protein